MFPTRPLFGESETNDIKTKLYKICLFKSIYGKQTITNKTRDKKMNRPEESTRCFWQLIQNPNTVNKNPGSLKLKT